MRHDEKPCAASPWLNDDAVARFWANIEKRGEDECWPWIGNLHGRDRGRIMVAGIRYPAAVFAWMVHYQERFPAGLDACHTCDNPPCCNIKHIWAGTSAENTADCIAKGRARKNPLLTAAIRLAKPFCGNGHPRNQDNTYFAPSGRRRCRVCDRNAKAARKSKGRLV